MFSVGIALVWYGYHTQDHATRLEGQNFHADFLQMVGGAHNARRIAWSLHSPVVEKGRLKKIVLSMGGWLLLLACFLLGTRPIEAGSIDGSAHKRSALAFFFVNYLRVHTYIFFSFQYHVIG